MKDKDYFEKERERLFGRNNDTRETIEQQIKKEKKEKRSNEMSGYEILCRCRVIIILIVIFGIVVCGLKLVTAILPGGEIFQRRVAEKREVILKEKQAVLEKEIQTAWDSLYVNEPWSSKSSKVGLLIRNGQPAEKIKPVVDMYYQQYQNADRDSFYILDFLEISLYKDLLDYPNNFYSVFRDKYWSQMKTDERLVNLLTSAFAREHSGLPQQVAKDYGIYTLTHDETLQYLSQLVKEQQKKLKANEVW